ncbi:hypothetical protein [Halopseudomonas bauzanensis]|uniref:hypothetical protein n=1 Tax=Halopseudomonas bauzanensis TaxID=653930 RepID=UPI0025571229|nr:hypothetical protein [Halopseudomonas bauzanensis]
MNLENMYAKMPVALQYVMINLQGYRIKRRRFNKDYYIFLDRYKNSNSSLVDTSQLRFFMQESLNVPYWRDVFKEFGVSVDSENLLAEIRKLPVLDKKFVRQNVDLFINKQHLNRYFLSKTSGTTGSSLCFPCTFEMENKQWAVWSRYREWHGIGKNTWMGWFGGKMVVSVDQGKPPYWRSNYMMKQLMFSSYHLSPRTVSDYFNKIKESKVTWLHGYPSQLSLLASLIKSEGLGVLPDIRVVTTGSETLLESQRAVMQEVFGVPIRQHYGLAEGVANISETKDGLLLPDQDFCFTEYLPAGNDCSNLRRIVGTNYNNLAFPLFRYNTGDLATVVEADGFEHAISLDGRVEDYITLKDGAKVGRLAHVFTGIDSIVEAQIHQLSVDRINVYVVRGNGYGCADTTKVKRAIREKIGDVSVDVLFLDSIPRTKSGKLRFVISDVH